MTTAAADREEGLVVKADGAAVLTAVTTPLLSTEAAALDVDDEEAAFGEAVGVARSESS